MAEKVRHRGVFPFPVPKLPDVREELEGPRSKGIRRLRSEGHCEDWVRDILVSLNGMFNGSEEKGSFEDVGRCTLSQQLCLRRVQQAVLDAGKPPEGITGQGALEELRTRPGYAGDPAHLAPMEIEKISLPGKGSVAATLQQILEEEAQSFSRRLLSKVSAEKDVEQRKEVSGLQTPYMDPSLKHCSRRYAKFLKRLEEAGLIEYRRGCRERVGAFTVWKKSGKQRLVIDSRLANLWFEKPEKVKLATGSSFAKIEVDSGPPIEVGGVDIADAFYNIELLPELREFFGLPAIRARHIGLQRYGDLVFSEGEMVTPVLKVVPMGWTHALWVCQWCHEAVVNGIPGLHSELRVVDRRRVPRVEPRGDGGGCIHTEYVDNFVALSQKPGVVFELASQVGEKLKSRGLPTHPVEAGCGIETLGWKFGEESPLVQITPKRMWKLRLATKELLKMGKASGKTMEKLLGHYTFAGLLQRGFLSVFQACYVFVRKHYEKETELWPEVKRELFWASSLVCLLRRDLGAPWSSTVHATDASFWGRGVVSTQRDVKEISKVASDCDRWRFNADDEQAVKILEEQLPMQRWDLETLADEELCASLEPNGDLDGVREVPLGFIGEDWSKVDSCKWNRVEGIPTLEGRAVVWVLQHLGRSSKNLGCRHLILSDSMSVVLALSKGRSSTRPMNRVCRQIAALEFITGMQLSVRWIPSEVNPADQPSRAQDLKGFSLKSGVQKLREGHVEKTGRVDKSHWRKSALQWYEKELGLTPSQPHASPGCPEGRGRQSQGQPTAGEGSASTTSSRRLPGVDDRGEQDLSGDQVHHKCSGEELCEGVSELLPMGSGMQPRPHNSRESGSSNCQPIDSDVLRWARSSRRSNSDGCREILSSRCGQVGTVGEVLQCNEGIQETGTGTGKTSHALSYAMRGGQGLVAPSEEDKPMVACGVGYVLPTGGSLEVTEEGSGGSISNVRTVDHHSQFRKGQSRGEDKQSQPTGAKKRGWRTDEDDIQSGRIRRGHHPRPTLSKGLGTTSPHLPQGQAPGRAHVRHQHRRGSNPIREGGEETRLRADRDRVQLPDQAWECLHRRSSRTPNSDRGAEKRKVECGKVGKAVLQWGSCSSGVFKPQPSSKTGGHCRREVDVKDFRCWHMVRQCDGRRIGLELFSGSGHFSKAMRRVAKGQFECFEVDIMHGNQFDLSSSYVQKEILGLLKRGIVVFVWLGTPCNSWSRARRWDGRGPGPLRDDHEFLMGLPNLSPVDQGKVHLGNRLMRFTAKVFRVCMEMGIPVTLENPHSSRLWLAPPIKHLLAHKQVEHGYTDYCQDHQPFRKRTRLMWSAIQLRSSLKQCTGARGLCSRTGASHEQLSGSVNGKFRTLLAQPYPHGLCRRLASAFQQVIFARIFEPWWKLFQGHIGQ